MFHPVPCYLASQAIRRILQRLGNQCWVVWFARVRIWIVQSFSFLTRRVFISASDIGYYQSGNSGGCL